MRKKHVGLYEEPTTYRYDYINHPLKEDKKDYAVQYVKDDLKRPVQKIKTYTAHDTYQSLDYETRLPFNALWEPKDTVQAVKAVYKRKIIGDPLLEETIKTRPRVFMSPAVCLDNVEDKSVRRDVIKFLYGTTITNMNNEVWGDFVPVHPCKKIEETEAAEINGKRATQKPTQHLPIGFQAAQKKWDFIQDRRFILEDEKPPEKSGPTPKEMYKNEMSMLK